MTKRTGLNLPEGTPILDMNSPTFAEDFANAAGINPGDTIEIHGPQFERTDGTIPVNPTGLFDTLHTVHRDDLKALGLREWGENGLWLFPHEWYGSIPEGFELTSIDGDTEPFEKGKTDDDYRFGMLAYGIVPDFERAS